MSGTVAHNTHAAGAASLPVLSESYAWAIAMAWQPQLQNRVRLVVDRDGPVNSIIKSYAWVRLFEPRPVTPTKDGINNDGARRHESMCVLRGVMLSWAALAACPGYSASENAVFWKRVISTLQENPDPPQSRRMPWVRRQRPQLTITDARGFFDQPGHVFPRFMIDMPDKVDDAFANLFSDNDSELTPTIKERLQSIMMRLRSFVPLERIEICLTTHAKYPFTTANSEVVSSVVEKTATVPSSFRISKLDIYDSLQFAEPKHIDGFLELTRVAPLTIRHFYFSPLLNCVTRVYCAQWLYAFLRLAGHGVQAAVTAFSFRRFDMSNAVFQALMSALPFATSTHSLCFDTKFSERGGSFEQVDLPWIAYAIFHPRAASSSWRHLELSGLTLTEHSTNVLTAMAKGNNLLALLNGTPPESDAYYSAQLSAGTVVNPMPPGGMFAPLSNVKREVLYVVPSNTPTAVDVCDLKSLDPATWGSWVAVVVPAFGLGWVHASDLRDVQAHAPARQSLTGLCLCSEVRSGPDATEEPPETVLHFLRPIGHMITYLDIGWYRDMQSSTLWEVLSACPSMKSLIASHSGEFWSEAEARVAPCETLLEELELSVDYDYPCVPTPSRECLSGPLRKLRVLRFRVWDKVIDQLEGSRETLAQLMRHAHRLRYLHWRNNGADFRTSSRGDSEVPYGETREWTPRALSQMELIDPAFCETHAPLTPSCAAAFLSVIARRSEQEQEVVATSIGLITDRGVLTTIFEFAGSHVPRVVFIEPNDKDSPTGEAGDRR